MYQFLVSAVAIMLAACSEPNCPSGYMQYGNTCRRCPPGQEREKGQCVAIGDAGAPFSDSASDMDVEQDPSVASMRDATSSGSADAGIAGLDAEAPRDMDNIPGFAFDAGGDAAVMEPSDATLADSTTPGDSTTVADGNIDVADCSSNPCQRGAACIDMAGGFRCECPAGSTGTRCELDICGETTILSRAGLDAARLCAEVRGNLSISSVGLASLTASDLPHLTRVTGDLVIGALAGAERTPLLEIVTLGELQRVDGALLVGGNLPGSLRELHMPALTSVGSGQAGAPGLRLLQTQSVVVDLPVLSNVGGGIEIRDFVALCTFKAAALTRITGPVLLFNIPNVPAGVFAPMRAAAQGVVTQNFVGCCSLDSIDCSEYTMQARDMYCGC